MDDFFGASVTEFEADAVSAFEPANGADLVVKVADAVDS